MLRRLFINIEVCFFYNIIIVSFIMAIVHNSILLVCVCVCVCVLVTN